MPPSTTELHKSPFWSWLQVPQLLALAKIPGWKTAVLPHHLPACGFLNLQAAVASWPWCTFALTCRKRFRSCSDEWGRGQRVNMDKERVTYFTLTLTLYWPWKYQERGEHWTSDLMNLALLQDLNLEEESVFGGLGQPQASPRASGNGSRNLLDLRIWSGTEDIFSNSSLSVLLLEAILLSVSALDQPVRKSSPSFLMPVLYFVSQRCSSFYWMSLA